MRVRANSNYHSEPLAIMRNGSLHWATMQLNKAPYFTKSMLRQLNYFLLPERETQKNIIKVISSAKAGVFSLGGDLCSLASVVAQRDEVWLKDYAFIYMTLLHRVLSGAKYNFTSIALVQGRAYGMGMELALCADCVIAEEGALFLYPPEIFHHGLEHVLVRKLQHKSSRCAVMEVMYSNRRFSAKELYELGLVDVLVGTGEGEQAVRALVNRAQACDLGHAELQKYRYQTSMHSFGQLSNAADTWVKHALNGNATQQKYLRRLARMQY
ncbi:enoyl-CoA hydratase-related protein [Pseudoalteromonas umbrosa]|uniref:enoyl-CoA hydratase-related protein n=1 Tax=Pseudoalteromonas umbrosa TaxID=3048489 RepID=UPI0024C3434C|nr:enoyl-CoA hydratase-related protein [Pseudoalteromonas sp. B95]MDK1286635.1 enoyl-CoA hydratase-related protein [Pseudoalteromonas sp. B95]